MVSPVDSTRSWYDGGEWLCAPALLLPKAHTPQSIIRKKKKNDTSHQKDLQNTCTAILKIVGTIKNGVSLKTSRAKGSLRRQDS